MSLQDESVVAGDKLSCSIADHVRRCEALILEEQSKVSPDNAVIAALCDSVRLAREHVAFTASTVPRVGSHIPRGFGMHVCPQCEQMTRGSTAGCDHCDLEDK